LDAPNGASDRLSGAKQRKHDCRRWSGFTAKACALRVQRQAREQACQRVCSGLTQQVKAIERRIFSVHATFTKI
jgi:hypothetical protein